MAQKRGGFTAVPGRRSVVEIEDGANWREIPGITSFSYVPGERPSTDAAVLEGERSVLGAIPVTDFTFPVGGYTPNSRVWTILRDSYENDTIVNLRITTPKITVFAAAASDPATVALAASTGIITLAVATGAGTNKQPVPDLGEDRFQRGMVFQVKGSGATIGGKTVKDFVIEYIDATNPATASYAFPVLEDGTIAQPSAANNPALAADSFDIVVPSLRWETGGTVKQFGGFEGGSEEGNILSSTLVFTPTGNAGSVGIPKIITT